MKKLFLLFAALPALIAITLTGCEMPDAAEDPAKVAAPAARPEGGALLTGDTVTLSTETAGAAIYYTTNGDAPTSVSALYENPVTISGEAGAVVTLKAVAVKEGYTDSDVLEAAYTVVSPDTAARPSADPAGGEVPSGTTVTLATATEGAAIYYTLDSTAPTSGSALYENPVTISGEAGAVVTLKAVAVKAGYADSDVLEAAYTVVSPDTAARPSADPAGGEVLSGTTVTLATATEGAAIYYTLDSTAPTSGSALYENPVTISGEAGAVVTLKAVAVKEGYADSGVLEAAYTMKVPGKAITAFSFAAAAGIIDGTEIAVAVPPFTPLAGLVPAITVSPGATVEPPSGEALDFREPVIYTVTSEDGSRAEYTVTVTAVCIDMAGAAAYLAAPTGGEAGTVTDPVPLPVRIFLNDSGGNGWRNLLKTIKDGGKYVELDLSNCTMTGNAKGVMEFDPGEADTGEAYVTALVLPDTAESIKAGTTGITGMLFRNFRSLKSIRGDNIVTVGAFAFGSNITSQKNTALTTAEFPRAESIGRYAFAYHTALTSLNLESAITLESQVFRGCTALRELNLPHAETIGNEAFRNCTALETLYVPKAVSLGMGLFQGTSTAKALTITLGSPAPSLGDLMFGGGSGIVTETVGNKKVTVRIPTGAEGYDTAWKDKFKTGLSGNKTPPAYEEYTPEEE